MNLKVYKDEETLYNSVASWITELINKILQQKDEFTWALSGGETPKKLYQKLASQPFIEKINWSKIHIFWGDERVVPFTDNNNNAKMAFDNLLSKVAIPAKQIHKINTEVDPDESANQYEKMLHKYFNNKQATFNLVLLGLGEDGHTLSLFPDSEILNDQSWVKAVNSKEKGERITLMPSVVNTSANIAFLVSGDGKSKILKKVFNEKEKNIYPAQLINPLNGNLYCFADENAAKELL